MYCALDGGTKVEPTVARRRGRRPPCWCARWCRASAAAGEAAEQALLLGRRLGDGAVAHVAGLGRQRCAGGAPRACVGGPLRRPLARLLRWCLLGGGLLAPAATGLLRRGLGCLLGRRRGLLLATA